MEASFLLHWVKTGFTIFKYTLLPQVVTDAHETPIQCLEYCEERDELATCGMGNKVHIWDISKPLAIKRKLVLDHSDGEVCPIDSAWLSMDSIDMEIVNQ